MPNPSLTPLVLAGITSGKGANERESFFLIILQCVNGSTQYAPLLPGLNYSSLFPAVTRP